MTSCTYFQHFQTILAVLLIDINVIFMKYVHSAGFFFIRGWVKFVMIIYIYIYIYVFSLFDDVEDNMG